MRDEPSVMGLMPDGDKANPDEAVDKSKLKPDATLKEVLRLPIFWSVALSRASFGLFWAGFNYHAVDLMSSLASLSQNETANYVFIPMSLAYGFCSFSTGCVQDRYSVS